jgi:hypothetical protein
MPVHIFFSYSHKDEELMHHIRRQLIPFDRKGLIDKWFDRKILAGEEWDDQIMVHLSSAQIILLLISPDLIESKYCYNLEMAEALRRHERGEAIVIPIILRPCLWQGTPIGKLQVLPIDGLPITMWENIDEATMKVAEGIMEDVYKMASRRNPISF